MMINLHNIPSPVDKILTDYLSLVSDIHPELIEGLYVTGSIPLGDYYPAKSDIDFLAFLKEKPSIEVLQKLGKIHHRLEQIYHHPKLNGYYMTFEELQQHTKEYPSFFTGRMWMRREFELDKVTLFELLTNSINVIGRHASELPIKVSIDEVIMQLHQNINTYWTTWVRQYSPFKPRYFVLVSFPRFTEWGLLGVARQLYTLETKKITSKLDAGLYYLDKLPLGFRNIMSIAIETRRLNKTQIQPSFTRADQTIACMKHIIAEFNKNYTIGYARNI